MRTPHHRDILSPAVQIRSSELDRTRDLPVTNVSLRDEVLEDTGRSVRLVVLDERLINDADVRTAIRATSRRLPGSTHHNVFSRDSNLQALLRSISHLRRHLRLRRRILKHRIPLILRHRKISLTQETTIVQHAMSKPRHRNILLRTIQLVRRNINRLRRLPVLDEHLVHKRFCSTRARVIRVLLHTILLNDPDVHALVILARVRNISTSTQHNVLNSRRDLQASLRRLGHVRGHLRLRRWRNNDRLVLNSNGRGT